MPPKGFRVRLTDAAVIARYWSKVPKNGPDECWPWLGTKLTSGYGEFKVGVHGHLRAHRVMLMLSGVEIPPGMNVLHRCDNPPCVNPSHLFLGTDRDNIQDMFAKGRGVIKPRAKLTVDQVREIRIRRANGERNVDLSREFGVQPQTITLVASRRHWRNIA